MKTPSPMKSVVSVGASLLLPPGRYTLHPHSDLANRSLDALP